MMPGMGSALPIASLLLWMAACGEDGPPGPDASTDAAPADGAGPGDGATADGRVPRADGSVGDAGPPPGRPLSCTLVDCPAPSGETITVSGGGDLQGALDRAMRGDIVEIAAGAVFRGNFVLRDRPGSGCLTVRTSTPDADLPVGVRVTPSDASRLARLETDNDLSALRVAPGAHHIRIVGLEVAAAPGAAAFIEVLALGSSGSEQSTLSDVPHHVTVERSFIHGIADTNIKRGIGLNSADTCVVDSWIDEIHSDFQDSQAIGGFNGPGPFQIFNNRLEGSAENIMFGGAAPTIADLVPSGIEIRRNHFFKPLAWRESDPANTGYTPWVKNLFECKNARDVVIEGNRMENNWAGADQHGSAIVLTPRGEGGAAAWASCENFRIEDNLILHVGGGVQIAGYDSSGPSGRTRNVVIRNNVFADIRADYAFDFVRVIQFNAIDGLVIDHNTFVHPADHDVVRAFDMNTTGFAYTNNVVPFGGGLWADCGTNAMALSCRLPGGVVEGNVFIGGMVGSVPGANSWPADTEAAGFVSYATGDADFHGYALSSGSPYAGTASDGTTPGIDPAAIDAAMGIGP